MKAREAVSTYAETSCGSFTALRKRMAFAAASSRLVAAAEPLGFFGRLPNRLGAALRLCAPPRAVGAADKLAPLLVGPRLAARDDFSRVVIWPVLEAGSEP